MRKSVFQLVLAVMLVGIGALALAQSDIDTHAACQYCGMDRKMHAHSRMLLVFDDGSEVGTCSLHCVAVDMALNIDKVIKSMKVADYNTKNLIDADKAFWVIGGVKPGVMSKRAKWAFGNKADAEAFVRDNQGTLADFEAAIKATYEDMYSDTLMIREKRMAKNMKHVS